MKQLTQIGLLMVLGLMVQSCNKHNDNPLKEQVANTVLSSAITCQVDGSTVFWDNDSIDINRDGQSDFYLSIVYHEADSSSLTSAYSLASLNGTQSNRVTTDEVGIAIRFWGKGMSINNYTGHWGTGGVFDPQYSINDTSYLVGMFIQNSDTLNCWFKTVAVSSFSFAITEYAYALSPHIGFKTGQKSSL